MGTPRVSICIPTFNMAHFLAEAIESALGQSYSDLEVVVCDDCSIDDTATAVGKFTDPRLRYLVNERNLGLFRNFNHVLGHARGEFVKFLCADDRLEPRYVETAVELFERFPRVGIVTALHRGIDSRGREIARHAGRRRRGPTVLSGQEMFRRAPWRHNELGTPSHVMVRREVFQRLGAFNLEYTDVNDWEMWLRIFREYDVGVLREYLVVIGLHSERASVRTGATLMKARDTFRLARAYYGDDWWKREILALISGEVYFWAAVRRLLFGGRSEARQLLGLLRENTCRPLLMLYIVGHFPFRCWRGIRRRYARLLGGVEEI